MTTLNPTEQLAEASKPMDVKIENGLSVTALTADTLTEIDHKVKTLAERLREDPSSVFGACVAYCLGLSSEEVSLLREKVKEAASSIFPNDHRVEGFQTVEPVWASKMGSQVVQLVQTNTPIVFNDGYMQEGTVFSMHASLR